MNYHRDKDYLKNESLFRNIFRKRFSLLGPYVSEFPAGRVLDVGCSNGVFLDLFKEKDWQTWGVEPSGSGETAGQKGHKILKTNFENAKLPQNYFDLVVLNHTLEHMDNPTLVLKKAYKILKKGGVVFIDVPNAGGLGSRLLGKYWPYRLPEEHKHQFTKESLSKIFKSAGFKVIHWESRSGVFEFANPFLELWQSLSKFKKRFFIGLLSLPYSALATFLNVGDSMSIIGRKI